MIGILSRSTYEESIPQPWHGVPLVAYYPSYYYEKEGESEILKNMPYARCRPGFTRKMEADSRGHGIPKSDLNIYRSAGDPTSDQDSGSQSDETVGAIISYMQQIDISLQSLPTNTEVQFLDATTACSKIAATGFGHFDVEPRFPCIGLFIDNRNCLLLEQTDDERHAFRRVGLGYFGGSQRSPPNDRADAAYLDLTQSAPSKAPPVNRDSPTRCVLII